MRWTNREIRNALRLLRRPHMLERERLAVMLRECTQARSGREALLVVIANAFDQADVQQRLLFEIIKRVDFAGETTRSAAANMHTSVRQFFRYRAQAIDAIAQSVERILRRPADSHRHLLRLAHSIQTIDPQAAREIYLRVPDNYGGQVAYNIVRTSLWSGVDVSQEQIDACDGPWRLLALAAVARYLIARGADEQSAALRTSLHAQLRAESGPIYDQVAFELTAQDILDAHRRGDVAESGVLTRKLRALAGANEQLLGYGLTIEAQQQMFEGDLPAAAIALSDLEALEVHNHDHYIMARSALCNAMLSYMRGFHHDAFALANGAGPAIGAMESGFAYRAAALAGRSALLAGLPWSRPEPLVKKYPNLWTRAELECVAARHLLAGEPQAALAWAETALALAMRHGSNVIIAQIRGTMAAAHDMLDHKDEAQRLWIVAWEGVMRLGDEFAAYDLFFIPAAPVHDIGPLTITPQFMQVLAEHVERDLPAFGAFKVETMRQVMMHLLDRSLFAALGQQSSLERLERRTVSAKLSAMQAHPEQLLHVAERSAQSAGRALSKLLPPATRQSFHDRFLAAWQSEFESLSAIVSHPVSLRA